MQYKTGEFTKVTFDDPDEVQALTWAASEMRRANPDDLNVKEVYEFASRVLRGEGTFQGEEAEAIISILKQWVAKGPPEPDNELTDGARTKSYITASAIVARVVELSSGDSVAADF